MAGRRDFLVRLGAAAATLALDANELHASADEPAAGEWDTSWLERLAAAQYRVVFNASEIADGAAMDYAAAFLDDFHTVHGTSDAQTRPVIVFRRLGTQMAFNDAMWDRFAIGDDLKITDSSTRAPARRNVFYSAAPASDAELASTRIDALQKRGLICLVCNIAVNNVGSRLAAKTQRNVDEVRRELKANLIPGAILVPSGIYALIRAQNAGCAWMPGT